MEPRWSVSIEQFRDTYRRCHYVYMPQILTPEQTKVYEFLTSKLPCKRVTCGNAGATWDEQRVPEDNQLFCFFTSDKIIELVRSVSNLRWSADSKIKCWVWVSRYRANEYINPHKDSAGTIQMILCLKSVEKTIGGLLVLSQGDRYKMFSLCPGDAILFQATAIEHYTTPLIPSAEYPNPMRIVAVSRYYLF